MPRGKGSETAATVTAERVLPPPPPRRAPSARGRSAAPAAPPKGAEAGAEVPAPTDAKKRSRSGRSRSGEPPAVPAAPGPRDAHLCSVPPAGAGPGVSLLVSTIFKLAPGLPHIGSIERDYTVAEDAAYDKGVAALKAAPIFINAFGTPAAIGGLLPRELRRDVLAAGNSHEKRVDFLAHKLVHEAMTAPSDIASDASDGESPHQDRRATRVTRDAQREGGGGGGGEDDGGDDGESGDGQSRASRVRQLADASPPPRRGVGGGGGSASIMSMAGSPFSSHASLLVRRSPRHQADDMFGEPLTDPVFGGVGRSYALPTSPTGARGPTRLSLGATSAPLPWGASSAEMWPASKVVAKILAGREAQLPHPGGLLTFRDTIMYPHIAAINDCVNAGLAALGGGAATLGFTGKQEGAVLIVTGWQRPRKMLTCTPAMCRFALSEMWEEACRYASSHVSSGPVVKCAVRIIGKSLRALYEGAFPIYGDVALSAVVVELANFFVVGTLHVGTDEYMGKVAEGHAAKVAMLTSPGESTSGGGGAKGGKGDDAERGDKRRKVDAKDRDATKDRRTMCYIRDNPEIKMAPEICRKHGGDKSKESYHTWGDCQWKGSCEKEIAGLGYSRLPKDGECLNDVPKGAWEGAFSANSGKSDKKKSELDILRLAVTSGSRADPLL